MASFCGVWMLSDESVEGFLSEAERRALRGTLSASAGEAVEVASGPLWMAASAARMRRGEGEIMA